GSVTANDWEVEVRLPERTLQPPPSRASSVAGFPELAGLAGFGKRSGLLEGRGVQNAKPGVDHIGQRLAGTWPVDTRLHGGARRNADGAHSTSSRQRGETCHRANQRLAHGHHIRLREEHTEPHPD